MAPTFTLLHHLVTTYTVAVIVLTTVTVGNGQIATFGECQPEKLSCRECYLELVRALFGRDDNVFNLSQTFTPPTFDQPSSVIVNYRFFNDCSNSSDINSCVDEVHMWFWAKSGAYLLHPLATFQFISLLFGNAQPLYEREVYVTLDATECYGVGPDHMTLLTQRLKIYIQEQSFYPKMDDNYIPVAANSTTVVDILTNSPYVWVSLSSEHILFICPFFVTIIILALLVIVLTLYACGGICTCRRRVKTTLKNHTRATILAFTVASFNRIVIFIGLDIAALIFKIPCSNPKVEVICEFSNLIHNTPEALLGYDLLALLFFLAFIALAILADPKLFSGFQKCRNNRRDPDPNSRQNRHNIRPFQYYCCTIAIMGFVLSCLMHSPYITMAYLSDAHYATSILVYYTTILFIEFGVFQYTFRSHFAIGSFIYKNKILTGVLVFMQTLLIYCLVLSASFFYYFIPISNTVSNLPNEGIIVYQTALILLGAFITYKALFKSKKSEQDVHTINLQKLSRQIKESEIADLKSKIKCVAADGKDHKEEIKFMRNKITHLQEEIKLMHIKNKITYLSDGPDDLTHPIEITRLKQQQDEIVAYLRQEVSCLEKETQEDQPNQTNQEGQQQHQMNQQGDSIDQDKKGEVYRLQCEIFDHLLTVKVQLEEKGHNIDAIECEMATFKAGIHRHLKLKKQVLSEQQANPQNPEINELISSIEEAITHLDDVCMPPVQENDAQPQHDQPRTTLCCSNNCYKVKSSPGPENVELIEKTAKNRDDVEA